MHCDCCGSSDSLFIVVSGNARSEARLCRVCALKKGYLSEEGQVALPQLDFLLEGTGGLEESPETPTHCPVCNMAQEELIRKGLLGCPSCVQVFRHQFLLARKRRGQAFGYAGRIPRRLLARPREGQLGSQEQVAMKIDRSGLPKDRLEGADLLAAIESAVLAEDFESAALLRDRFGSGEINGRSGDES